jgi:hypothetical protein
VDNTIVELFFSLFLAFMSSRLRLCVEREEGDMSAQSQDDERKLRSLQSCRRPLLRNL